MVVWSVFALAGATTCSTALRVRDLIQMGQNKNVHIAFLRNQFYLNFGMGMCSRDLNASLFLLVVQCTRNDEWR